MNKFLVQDLIEPRSETGLLRGFSDCLRAGRSGDRNSMWAKIYSSIRTGIVAQRASYTMGTVSFPGSKAAEAWR